MVKEVKKVVTSLSQHKTVALICIEVINCDAETISHKDESTKFGSVTCKLRL